MSQEIAEISIEQALALCSRPEDQFFDRKSKLARGKTAQKIAVAFGNAEGGEVVFGVKDDSDEAQIDKRLDLFADPEGANDILQSMFSINPALNFRYVFHTVMGNEGVLLRIFIDKGQHVHATADGSVYRRVGAGSLLVKDPAEITRIAFS